MQTVRIIGAVIGGACIVAVLSVVWPIFSEDPRPEALTRVYGAVIETPLGQNLESVLGVASGEPLSVSSVVTTGTSAVVDAVTKSAQRAVTSKILESLAGQFEHLTQEEKEEFRALICEPIPPAP